MKNRVSFLIGLSMVFILSFVILILVSYAQTDVPELANAQELIKKAFPNSKITWSKQIEGEMLNYRANPTALAILIVNGDQRNIRFINFKDTTEWSMECDNRSCRQYDMVEGDEPKLLIRGFEHGMSKTKVIDTKGEEIFDLTLTSWLLSSPTGRYYHTVDNQDSYNILKVYDSRGTFLWEREEYQGGDWFSQALSDSELIYEDNTGCYLLNSFSGEEIWKIPRNQYRRTLSFYKFLHIISSSNNKYFVLFNGDGLVSFSKEGEILWQIGFPLTVFSAAISDDGRYVSVYSGKKMKSPRKELCLMDNLHQGKILWRVSVETEKVDWTNSIGGLAVVKDMVSVIPGIVPYHALTEIMSDMHTFCYQIDTSTGKLINEFLLPGVAEFVESDQKTAYFFLLNDTAEKEIYEISEVLVK